jgi:N-carbamoylputrescine amidase
MPDLDSSMGEDMTENTFIIGLVQHASGPDRDVNIGRAVEGIRQAASKGAQIICLQELFNAPYFCKVESAERFDLAEPIPGPTVAALQPLARELKVAIVVPVFERRAAGVYHNSVAVLDADGSLLGAYRKMHIPDDPLFYEKFYFAPGDAAGPQGGFRVWKTRYATIGTLICWDQWYPEGARITSLMGAEVLFYPTAIGWHPREKAQYGAGQLDAWQTMQRAHAIANGVYVAAVNRIGHEPEPGTDGIEFFGHSFVADPFGKVIAEAGESEPAVLVATCDRRHAETVRRNWPFLRDRRIDAYSPILARYLGDE